MIFMMCRPRPGELLCSALMRSARRVRMTLHVFLHRLFGQKVLVTFHGWWQVEVMARALGMQRDQLLRENTDLPFLTSLMPQSFVDKAFEAAGAEDEGSFAYVTAVGRGAFGPRRWCAVCTKDDLEVYGDSHWRVSHNLQGVTVCHLHKCRLLMTSDSNAGSGIVRDIRLPHECTDGLLVGVAATPFFCRYADVAFRRFASPVTERAAKDGAWLRERLATLDFCVGDRPILVRELCHVFESLLGATAENILGDSVQASIKKIARAPWDDTALQAMPHRYVALQTALELSDTEISPHLTDSVVFNGRNKNGVSPFDEQRAAIAAKLIDAHIHAGTLLPVKTLLMACGARVRPSESIFPKLYAQLRRLSGSPVSARNERASDLSDDELAAIAQSFIDARASRSETATTREVLKACGVPVRRDPYLYPSFERVIESFQRSTTSWIQCAAFHDARQASVAKDMIDEAVANNEILRIDDVLRACGHSTNRNDLRTRPLLAAQIKRLQAAVICARQEKSIVDARAAATASAFIDERMATNTKTSVKEVMFECRLPLPYAHLPGYPLLRIQLERLMKSRIAAYYKRSPKLNREGDKRKL